MFQPLIWKKFYNRQATGELLFPATCCFTAKLLPLTHARTRFLTSGMLMNMRLFIFYQHKAKSVLKGLLDTITQCCHSNTHQRTD